MGLAAIKEKNVMHRDLKLPNILVHLEMLPQNVMVDKSFDLKSYIAGLDFSKHHGQIKFKMADLGFARRLQDDELAETSCGTPLLMAPEVLKGETYNHKADIWSIGCIFYELLCGFVPFTGRNYEDLKSNLEKGAYFIPKTVKLSVEGLQFLSKCLQYSTVDRCDWQELCLDPYITNDNFEFMNETDLMLSQMDARKHELFANREQPQIYLRDHKHMAVEVNIKDGSKLDAVYEERIRKYSEQMAK